MDIVLNSNEYFTGLVNFILFMRLYATNTSKRQKSIIDVFASETLEYGDRKAFPFAELPKVEDYSLTSSLLTDKPIKYTEEFIGSPIKKKISLSRVEPYLKMAMMNSSGMVAFVGYILGLMESAKENYLYNEIMTDILSWTPTNSTGKEMIQTVDLIDTSDISSPTDLKAAKELNQQEIELKWQKAFDDFSIFTDIFLDINNGTGTTATNFQSAVKPEDLIFIGNAKFLNERVVNLMATMFNSKYIADEFRHPYCLKVPQRTFDGNNKSNVIGFVCHKYWYQWFYHFTFMGNFFDPDTVRIKNVLHFWYSKGRLKNLPATQLSANYVKPVTPPSGG